MKRSKSETDDRRAKKIKSQEQTQVSTKEKSTKTVKSLKSKKHNHVSLNTTLNKNLKTKYGKKLTPGKKKINFKNVKTKMKDVKPSFQETTSGTFEKTNRLKSKAGNENLSESPAKSTDVSPSLEKTADVSKKKKGLMKKGAKRTFQEFPKKLIGKDGKPEWTKVKIEKKKLKEKRKVHRTGEDQYQLSMKAKSIWEKLRLKKIGAEKKESLVNDLFMLLKGQIPNVIHSHDMARVVQWMLKLGSTSVRTSICEALCANTVTYLQSKYASHCVKRALHYGSKTDRNQIIESCKGHFHKLLSHTFGCPIVELMYTKFASSDQRKQMHRELYGEMSALISSDTTCIREIPDDLRAAILAATKANLVKMLSKKELLKSTLLQSVLHDFLSSCSDVDRVELSELLQGNILELNDSKEGSRVALLVIWSATNKIKKVIVKSIKGKMKEIASSESGHIWLMALFDSIDDTVLVKKALIPELVEEAKEIAKDECGRKVILYLVARRDPAYFHPQQIKILSQGDAISKRKKDTAIREKEMLEAVSGSLLKMITADPAYWFGESSVAMVSLAIMKSGSGDSLKRAFEKVIAYILDPNSVIEVSNRQFHVIEQTACHFVLKKLIQQDQTRALKPSETFSSHLVANLTEENLKQILQFNRGCFLLVLLFESNNSQVCEVLKSKLTDSLKVLLRKQETTGAKILLKKLAS